MNAGTRLPVLVLGGSGYVAGELLRLLLTHPRLELALAVSESQPGTRLAAAFPHLASAYPDLCFGDLAAAERLIASTPVTAVLAAAPHGVSAGLLDRLLSAAAAAGTRLRVVDISADYRYADPERYAAVYRHAHGAPARLAEFSCALPEHLAVLPTPHVAHPGCFATALLLAIVPLVKLGLTEPVFYVAAVTGSTGSGRVPVEGTHHPRRHSDLYAYGALAHRHAPEVVAIVRQLTGVEIELNFVPHSGPYARGIHATTQARLIAPRSAAALAEEFRRYYAGQPFVRVRQDPPRLKDVVGSNYAELAAMSDGRSVAVMSVLDNLTNGAAGGALQWLNRMCGWDETLGLTAPAPGWT